MMMMMNALACACMITGSVFWVPGAGLSSVLSKRLWDLKCTALTYTPSSLTSSRNTRLWLIVRHHLCLT